MAAFLLSGHGWRCPRGVCTVAVRKPWGACGEGCFKAWGAALQSDFHLSVCKMCVRHSFNVHLTEVLGSSDFLLCEFTPKEEECFPKSAVAV